MRVHIGGDHAAFELHQELLTFLAAIGEFQNRDRRFGGLSARAG